MMSTLGDQMGYTIFLIQTYDDARKAANVLNEGDHGEDVIDALFDAVYKEKFGAMQILRKRVRGKGMDDIKRMFGTDAGGATALTKKQAVKVAEYFGVKLEIIGKVSRYPVLLCAF